MLFFYASILIYSIASSPTPDYAGAAEFAVAVCILTAVGLIRSWNAVARSDLPSFLSLHRFFLLYMTTLPLITALLAANPTPDILRDIIPLTFMALPLCLYGKKLPHLNSIVMIGGAGFALRYIAPFVWGDYNNDSLLYLANSPLVPFACITGFHYFTSSGHNSLAIRLCGLAICAVCFMAMAAMLQRAPVALCLAGCLLLTVLRFPSRPIMISALILIIAIITLQFLPLFIDIALSLSEKTISVGWNNRFEEWQAVLHYSTFWGHGWGASWQSPAVADIWVRYTHNMVTYYWLKAGIIGAMMACAFIYVWGRQIILYLWQNPALGIAVAVPFIIHVTLYTGFKTLDFAVILTLLTVRDASQSKIHSDYQSCVSADHGGNRTHCMRSGPLSSEKRI